MTPAQKAGRIGAVVMVGWLVVGLELLALLELRSELDRQERLEAELLEPKLAVVDEVAAPDGVDG